jgi:hypothetical protein
MATPNLPPEWLLRLQQLQQMQEQQQAEQSAGIGGAAALQAAPQEQFDARFAGLDSALASAQNPQPPIPALPSWEERALTERPYVTGSVEPIYETLPWLNALGRGVKKTPILGEAVGGLADLAATAGSSRYQPRDSLAAGIDMIPAARATLGVGAKAGNRAMQKARSWYGDQNWKRQVGVEGGANVVPFNPYERSPDDPVFQR